MSTVYRVIAAGTHIQPLRLIASKRNGFHEYEVLEPDPIAGTRFHTRQWYADCTPLGALLTELEFIASRQEQRIKTIAADRHPGDAVYCARIDSKAHNAIVCQIQMIASRAGLLQEARK